MNERFTLHHGDCVEVMRSMPDNSVDSIVTDPPYGLEFMGKEWDAPWKQVSGAHAEARTRRADEMSDESKRPFIAAGVNKYVAGYGFQLWCEQWAKEALRVLKPGGHLLAFSGSRTYHRMAVAIEDAGFEIRDQIMWIYGSGFPKSLNVSKAIDNALGAERTKIRVEASEVRNPKASGGGRDGAEGATRPWIENALERGYHEVDSDLPATDEARRWSGFGTALKPAHEPIVVARKPLHGTVAANVLAHGVGALNIDGCRVAADGENFDNLQGRPITKLATRRDGETDEEYRERVLESPEQQAALEKLKTLGRWPANVIHDGSNEVVALFPANVKGGTWNRTDGARHFNNDGEETNYQTAGSDKTTGSAARFFYCAKANKRDRNEGLDGFEAKPLGDSKNASLVSNRKCKTCGHHKFEANPCKCVEPQWEVTASGGKNHHPTVKPCDLMRYLIRLCTPPGATVLDPFMGSGSTGKAAMFEGVNFIGIEQDAEYLSIARARIEYALNKPAEEVLFPREEPTTEQLVADAQLPLFTQDTA